ncbi:xanthine dehydrogenase family protein molybdopterin-binding subunit [Roseibium sp. MMSF_3544]|uniref:xanthine dehydrogenase family protein molybdopterin-binding subunit n=1 Tax=unclassified Roseibium TaxID=2629323 RepID=UPI00273D5F10|nr:molybdopterin cofactor-binding domain-containing protein [Roseibium sp. MMSF_3544]
MSSVEFRKDLFADERDDNLQEIGKPTRRQDILGHVTGRSPYYDDHLFDGLLHMRCVRSPHHHARIRSIDTSQAERMPGVVRVVLARDVPNNLNTLLSLINFGKDEEKLIQDTKVAYVGEPVAAIIAETEGQARDACAAVRVDYEVLPHVLDPEASLKPDAPVVNEIYPNNTFDYHDLYDHQKLRFGDVEKGFSEADHIVEGEYQMSPIEQAPIETCGAIAAPETNDRFVCYTSTQALFFSLGTTAKLLNMASSRLHFVGGTVGGGFGGKVDSIVEPLSVLGAVLTGRPVKFMWDRAEEMQVGAPRGAERWRIKDGVARDGRILARTFTGFFDAGAYTRLSSYAIIKCTGHIPGPYSIPNVASNVYCVFTNRTPATAMRGFGITGVDFAIECHMDKVAETVGLNPIELRILNAYRDGDMKPHRRLAKNTALIECCQVASQKSGWAISADAARQSSLTGGGGSRADIPESITDSVGRIGERRRTDIPTEPGMGAASRGRVAAGTQGIPIVAAAPQDEDMITDPARMGFRHAPVAPSQPGATPSSPVPPSAAPSAAPVPPQQNAPAPQPAPPQQPAAPQPPQATPDPAPAPYKPEQPFSRGVKRPGVSRFLSGSRRR